MLSEASARLVQLTHPEEGRRVAIVDGNHLRLLASFRSAYSFAKTAMETGLQLRDLLSTDLSGVTLDYEQTYQIRNEWRFLASFDHPEPARCLVASIGATGEDWTYLGLGTSLVGHGETILLPSKETKAPMTADVAGVYVIAPDGSPRRIGVAAAWSLPGLARNNVVGPELVLDPALATLSGSATLHRDDHRLWEKEFSSRAPLLYALASVEPSHFRYRDHHRPGDAHIVLVGSRLFDSKAPATIQSGERFEVKWEGLGKPLINPLIFDGREERRLSASPL